MTHITIAPTLANGTTIAEAATVARAQIAVKRRELRAHVEALPTLTGMAYDFTARRIADLEGALK